MKRLLINGYRKLIYWIFGLNRNAVIQDFTEVELYGLTQEDYFNDVVHPCVLRLETPYLGSYWWMVYTPYRNYDSSTENPVICRACESGKSEIPLKWERYKVLVDKPDSGYNSDPFIFWKDSELYFGWRESHTSNTSRYKTNRGIFLGKMNHVGHIHFFDKPILTENSLFQDKTVSPHVTTFNGETTLYSMCLRFRRRFEMKIKARFVINLLSYLDLLYLLRRIKSYGVLAFDLTKENDSYSCNFIKIYDFENMHFIYQPWHHEVFVMDGQLYILAISNKENGDIIIGRLDTKSNKIMFNDRPIITPESSGLKGIYKPSVIVMSNYIGIYFSAQYPDKRGHNHLFFCKVKQSDLK